MRSSNVKKKLTQSNGHPRQFCRITNQPAVAHLPLLLTLITGFAPVTAAADEDDVAVLERYTPTGQYRLDFSYSQYDTFVGDVDLFLATYTWAPRQNLRFSIAASAATTNIDGGTPLNPGDDLRTSGMSDTLFGIQYDPSERLTASPWVPDRVGLNAQLVAPTGNANKGLSLDAWYVNLGAGWAIDSVGHLWLVPAIGYEFTFAEDPLGAEVNQPYVSVDIAWVFQFGGWVSIGPRLSRDFESDEWVDEYVITVGKMFQNGFGVSLDYGNSEQLKPLAKQDDRTVVINFYYQFGEPPGT